uniref:Uncharacterized protein n=1 Tax=Guillardia theta TaxID=55529 RepID=A0A7S4U852_GUITH
MGNNNSVMECCGPCTVVRDKKNTLDIDMEDQKMQDPFETSFDGIDHSLLSNSAFQEQGTEARRRVFIRSNDKTGLFSPVRCNSLTCTIQKNLQRRGKQTV